MGELARRIESRTGLHFAPSRAWQLEHAIQERTAALGLRSAADYTGRLKADPDEWQALLPLIVTVETYFQRDQDQLDLIRRHVFPSLRTRSAGAPAVLWVAGCSSGEDAYTLAAMLHEERIPAANAEVLGTDINIQALAKAEAGLYGRWSLRGASPAFVEHGFRRADDTFEVLPHLRQRVRFRPHNLVAPDLPCLPASCALVLCRNVMIYWREDSRRAVAGRFRAALAPGGWLVTGHNELQAADALGFHAQLVDGMRVFRAEVQPPLLANQPARARPPLRPAPPRATSSGLENARRLADKGDLAGAVADCRAALARDAGSVEATHLLATLLREQGDASGAERQLRQAIYLDPSFAPAQRDLALLLEAQGRHSGAERVRHELHRLLAGGDRFRPDDAAV